VRSRDLPVARQVLVLQVLVVLVLVVASIALAAYDARRDTRDAATEQSVAVAQSVADSPNVVSVMASDESCEQLQPFAETVRRDTDVDFVVVMDPDRIRCTHPVESRIGEEFVGDVGDAPEGGIFTQEFEGTLGPSMRAVVPVTDAAGDVVGMVSVGITISTINEQLRDDIGLILLAAVLVLGAGLVGAWLVSRRLKRVTHGMGELEISRMYEYYSAVLHAVREGLLLLDDEGRVQLVNDEASRLLGLPEDVIGRRVRDLGLPPGLVAAALGRVAESDDVYIAADRVLVVSSAPATWQGREVGAVVSLRDHTELRAVTGELDVVRGLTESLRSQNHEAANRLHTVVSLIEMGRPDDAVEFATHELRMAQQLTDRVVGQVGDPVLAALLLGKTAQAAERGIELTIEGDLPRAGGDLPARDLVTVVGNLVDNAMDAVTGHSERRVGVRFEGDDVELRVVVGDSGPGLTSEQARHAQEAGWSTKASSSNGGRGIGLALVGRLARRYGGEVSIGVSSLGGAEFTATLRVPVSTGTESR